MKQDNIKNIGAKLSNLKEAAGELQAAIDAIQNKDFALGNYLRNIKNVSLQMKDLCVSGDRQLMFLSNEYRGYNMRQQNIADRRKRSLEELRRKEKRDKNKNSERM